MLKKSHRLTGRQLDEVMEKGRVCHSPLFITRTLVADSSSEKGTTQVAAVAPVKIAKTAALRNSIRRKVYEAVGPLIAGIDSSAHVVIIAKPAALKADVKAMGLDIGSVFKKVGIVV